MYPTQLIKPKKPRRSRRKAIFFSILVLLIAITYITVAITRPFAELQPTVTSGDLRVTTSAGQLPWPSYQGAFGLVNGKVIATHNDQTPLAMASTAKVVTALLVIAKHPLDAGASGPTITMTANDVQLYNRYVAIHGSVLPVFDGQKLTERHLLQALLLPSANNIADSLAIWAYGSLDAYITEANQYLKQKNITSTVIGADASGFSPASVSTASDLVKIGALAMSSPALAEIVGQKTATIPGNGIVGNVNTLIGSNNIIGLKTGNNDQNNGVFIGAAKVNVSGKQTTVISAVTGASSLSSALRDSAVLLAAVPGNFAATTIVKKGAVLGTYRQANGSVIQAVAASDLNVTVLRGDSVNAAVKLRAITYNTLAGQRVGTIAVAATDFSAAQSAPVILKQPTTKPGLRYRLLHP